jgi:hypothetical protein
MITEKNAGGNSDVTKRRVGRPALGVVRKTVQISPDDLRWIKAQGHNNLAKYFRDLIAEKRSQTRPARPSRIGSRPKLGAAQALGRKTEGPAAGPCDLKSKTP